MISGKQRDRLGDHPHIALEVIEPGVHIVETLPHQSFDGWGRLQKILKSSFNQHALADARAIGCHVKPTADAFTQPNRYFAPCRGFPPARLADVSTIGLRIKIGQLLHL